MHPSQKRKKQEVSLKMSIKVICQSTEDRRAETIRLYEQVKPYLDKGIPLSRAVKTIRGYAHNGFQNRAWYKELREYAISQGYERKR